MSYELTAEELEQKRLFERQKNRYQILPEEEKVRLIRAYQAGDKQAGEKALKHDLGLVGNVAKKYTGRGLPLGDLYQEASMGYMKGISKFDPDRGFRVTTYVTWWVRQAVTRAIENKGKLVRIPSHKQQQANKVKWAYRSWLEKRAEEGDEDADKATPTAKDLSEFCNLSIEQIEETGPYLKEHVSLSSLCGDEDEGLTLEEYLAASIEDQPEEQIERTVDLSYLYGVLETRLEPGERDFILLRFGFLDGVARDKRSMSEFTGLTPSENQKREEMILSKLKGLIDLGRLNRG